jgi:hypothetical protein
MEGQEQEVVLARQGLARFPRLPDLSGPREEDEHVALWPLDHEAPDGRDDLVLERPVVGLR